MAGVRGHTGFGVGLRHTAHLLCHDLRGNADLFSGVHGMGSGVGVYRTSPEKAFPGHRRAFWCQPCFNLAGRRGSDFDPFRRGDSVIRRQVFQRQTKIFVEAEYEKDHVSIAPERLR